MYMCFGSALCTITINGRTCKGEGFLKSMLGRENWIHTVVIIAFMRLVYILQSLIPVLVDIPVQ